MWYSVIMDISRVEAELKRRQSELSSKQGQKALLEKQIRQYKDQIDTAREAVDTLDKAIALIGQYADAREGEVQEKIEKIVTTGLRTVFEENLSLSVQQRQVGKRTEVDFKIISAYGTEVVETDIMSSRGGGVAAVTGFLLRVVMILLVDAPRILFLDEVFAQVSDEFMDNVAHLLDDLANEYGFQFVLVAHRSPELVEISDAVYTTQFIDGTTTYKKQ